MLLNLSWNRVNKIVSWFSKSHHFKRCKCNYDSPLFWLSLRCKQCIFNLETLKLKAKGQKMFVHFGKLVQLGDQKFAIHLMRTAYNKLIKRKSYTTFTTDWSKQSINLYNSLKGQWTWGMKMLKFKWISQYNLNMTSATLILVILYLFNQKLVQICSGPKMPSGITPENTIWECKLNIKISRRSLEKCF